MVKVLTDQPGLHGWGEATLEWKTRAVTGAIEEPRAVVVICHGVNSHGGQHARTAEKIVSRGFALFAVDLRGRGKSEASASTSKTSPSTWRTSAG